MARSSLALLFLAPLACFAHQTNAPHTAQQAILHPLTGLDHLLALLAVGWLAAQTDSLRSKPLLPSCFLGGMLGGFFLGLAGVSTPSIEYLVAFSVIALGALISWSAESRHSWVFILVAGMVHGMVHGAEMPATAGTSEYLAWLATSSATLILLGGLVQRACARSSASPILRYATSSILVAAGVSFLIGLA
ncbi:MAG: HupE/UreJ family protein [Fibrobacteria bacterium]|nr:HupE/UreJ family protein [Fibrobacteria bacterium]